MKVKGLIIASISTIGAVFAAWYLTRVDAACSVYGAGRKSLNGYYEALGGLLLKRGIETTYNPDIFKIFDLKRHFGSSSIAFGLRKWIIVDHTTQETVYTNSPEHPEKYLYRPPGIGWKAMKEDDKSNPVVNHCSGSLENSPPLNVGEASNIGQLLQRPVTTILLGSIFAIAYYLWAYKVDVSAVSYSYEAVVQRGEYWRIFSASFAHFDLLHLGFNTMSLYQLGALETVLGSATFLYLNIALVVVTMLICTIIYHVLITRYGRTDMVSQQAVGFSCVLFAWMVVVSALQPQFCPIFLLPDFCIKTWFIPLPAALNNVLGVVSVPVNLGPFVLLILTKLILPRSSFIGHLSGILIGYPVAWNMLNWLSLPVLCCACLLGYLYLEKALIWTLPGFYATNFDLDSFTTPSMLRNYKILHILAYFIGFFVLVGVYFMGPAQLVPRVTMFYMALSAVHACRMELIATTMSVKETCSKIMALSAAYLFGMFVYDACNLVATMNSAELIIGCGLGINYVRVQIQHLEFVLILQCIFVVLLMMNLLDTASAGTVLKKARFDLQAVVDDLMVLTCTSAESLSNNGHNSGASASSVAPFSGTAHRLNGSANNVPVRDSAATVQV